jgi:hypothetical protein
MWAYKQLYVWPSHLYGTTLLVYQRMYNIQVNWDYIVTTILNIGIAWKMIHGEASMSNVAVDWAEMDNSVFISINDYK